MEIQHTAIKPRTDAVKVQLSELRDSRKVLMTKEAAELQAAEASVTVGLTLSFIAAFLIGASVAFLLARLISHSTRAILAQAEAIAAGSPRTLSPKTQRPPANPNPASAPTSFPRPAYASGDYLGISNSHSPLQGGFGDVWLGLKCRFLKQTVLQPSLGVS